MTDVRNAAHLTSKTIGCITGRNGNAVRIQKVGAIHACSYVIIQCGTDVARRIDDRFPRVVHDRFWVQSLHRHLQLQLAQKCFFAARERL